MINFLKNKLTIFFFLSFCFAQSQNFTVKGVVEDSDGVPVAGANIIEKENPLNGSVTDFDGVFTIRVSENSNLEISYVGYETKEIYVDGRKELKITIVEDLKSLDEVTIVAY